METVKSRLKSVIEALNLRPLSPASTCKGITKAMMQRLWASDTDTVTTNILVPFCETYSYVNCNWLIRGVGSMFIEEESQVSKNIPTPCDSDNYYKQILIQLLSADTTIAKAEAKKKELYAQIADKI